MKNSRLLSLLLLLCFCIRPAFAMPDLPKEVVINGVEFVHVPSGWFWYAVENSAVNTAGRPGYPPHYRDVKVWLDGFYIGKYEARAKDFKRFMDSKDVVNRAQYAEGEVDGCSLRRNSDGEYYLVDQSMDLPATYLSWDLADEFARWMGFRLPTEGEWIKAARGTDKRFWPWGDEYPDDTKAGYNADIDCKVSPVDAFPLGKSPYGAYNMAGNVYEFVQDWFNEDHDAGLKDGMRNPPPPETASKILPYRTPMKIMHGGRWASVSFDITVHRRNLHRPDGIFICYGARFAIDESAVLRHIEAGTARVVGP